MFILFLISSFLFVVYIISKQQQCSFIEALRIVYKFFMAKVSNKGTADSGVFQAIYNKLFEIYGEDRFYQYEETLYYNLNSQAICSGSNYYSLPYYAVCIMFDTDKERKIIEKSIVYIIKQYLCLKGFAQNIYVTRNRVELDGFETFIVCYATNIEEFNRLNSLIEQTKRNNVSKAAYIGNDSDSNEHSFLLGYDYESLDRHSVEVPIYASACSHIIVVGGSGSGKSTFLLYILWNLRHENIKTYIADFKKSRELDVGTKYAEFEDCYQLIKDFYQDFLDTPEGGDGQIKVLLIDEIAGMLSHYSSNKEDKSKADEIRSMLSSILMLGRSRKCFLWLSMQRYSASIFPSSSGAADNFHIMVGLGNLTVDGRKGLFAGEHFEYEDKLMFGTGKGIVYIDGQGLKGLIIPSVSKEELKTNLRNMF